MIDSTPEQQLGLYKIFQAVDVKHHRQTCAAALVSHLEVDHLLNGLETGKVDGLESLNEEDIQAGCAEILLSRVPTWYQEIVRRGKGADDPSHKGMAKLNAFALLAANFHGVRESLLVAFDGLNLGSLSDSSPEQQFALYELFQRLGESRHRQACAKELVSHLDFGQLTIGLETGILPGLERLTPEDLRAGCGEILMRQVPRLFEAMGKWEEVDDEIHLKKTGRLSRVKKSRREALVQLNAFATAAGNIKYVREPSFAKLDEVALAWVLKRLSLECIVLNLSGSLISSNFQWERFPNLEELYFNRCEKLRSLNFWSLHKLKRLEATYCMGIDTCYEMIPSNKPDGLTFRELIAAKNRPPPPPPSNLEIINFEGCVCLKNLSSLAKETPNLRSINLKGTAALRLDQRSIEHFRARPGVTVLTE